MSRTKVAHMCKSSDKWDKAISDAQRMIKEAKGQIAQLKFSIRTFERLRDSGAPFPGEETFEADRRLMGQE
jgi:hypothetical protein